MFLSTLPCGAGNASFSRSSRNKNAPIAKVKSFGARAVFRVAGSGVRRSGLFLAQLVVSALALHGAAFGQDNTPEFQLVIPRSLAAGMRPLLPLQGEGWDGGGVSTVKSTPIPTWQAHNRSLLAGIALLDRHYTESDNLGLTSDGILDSEKGTLNGGAIRGRWQGAPFGENHPQIFLQGEYRQHTGSTSYQGYLQSGLTLTPYSATTHNELHDFRARIGIPLTQTESMQWVPFIEYCYQNWVRNFAKFSEIFQI